MEHIPNEYRLNVALASKALQEVKQQRKEKYKYHATKYFKNLLNPNDRIVIISEKKLSDSEVIEKIIKLRPNLK